MKRVENGKVGECPTCESYDIEYGVLTVNGGSVYYPAKCESCGFEFREYYELEFDAHYIEEPKYSETT